MTEHPLLDLAIPLLHLLAPVPPLFSILLQFVLFDFFEPFDFESEFVDQLLGAHKYVSLLCEVPKDLPFGPRVLTESSLSKAQVYFLCMFWHSKHIISQPILLSFHTLVHRVVCLPRLKKPPLSVVLDIKSIIVVLQFNIFFRFQLFRHITKSEFNRVISSLLFGKFRMLGGVLVFADGVRSENSGDVIDAKSPHKMVFLLVDLCLRITRWIMSLPQVNFFFGMQQNMVFLQVYFVVLFCQFLELDIERHLRDALFMYDFVSLLIL